MSSATSIKSASSGVRLKAETADRTDAGFRPWHFFVLASLVAATGAVVLSGQSTPEHLILISLTIGAAGIAAAGFYRMLAPLATDDASAFSEPLTERMRAGLEREKTLVLRAIKELEFDRAMGKLSPRDFDEMVGRLRSRAITLMRQLDEEGGGYRAIIERDLRERLAKPSPAPQSAPEAPAAAPALAAGTCGSCGTTNDGDALFCKRCGTKLH